MDRDDLEDLIQHAYEMQHKLAVQGGCSSHWEADWRFHDSDEVLVTLACEAGIPLPGPMAPDQLPPAPPPWLGRLTAPTYRGADDQRLRCCDCGKVVYGNSAQAKEAAARITTERQAMRWYMGECGHFHLSRVKGRKA